MEGRSPAGTAAVGELSAEQQEKLRHLKVQTRIENERYLSSHPEVELMVGRFLRDVLLKRPTDIQGFAAEHFTNPNLDLMAASRLEGSRE